MELRFSMDAAALQQLTEDIIASRLARHEQTFERLAHWQARLLAPLTLSLIVLLLALLPGALGWARARARPSGGPNHQQACRRLPHCMRRQLLWLGQSAAAFVAAINGR